VTISGDMTSASASARSLSDYRVGVWLDDSASPVDSEVLGVLEGAVTQLDRAGARIDTATRPVDLADSNALFVNLLMAAVSPGVPDWNQTNERRQQLRARWQAFFRSFDVLLTRRSLRRPAANRRGEPQPGRAFARVTSAYQRALSFGVRSRVSKSTWMSPKRLE
jgi:Asp-tRNA(Asn)/Glu-tRNA(Gln) amidotransferase A subunit family amidase